MTISQRTLATAALCLFLATGALLGSELVPGELRSDLVPSPVEYYALLPEGYSADHAPYPLVLNLHGGRGSRENLVDQRAIWDELWADGSVPPMVVVMPSVTARGFYVDTADGSEKWETFLVGPFIEHLRSRFNVRRDRRGLLATGASMGGMGSLRMAFKHPQVFGAVAGMEPGIEPIMEWSEMRPKHRFWRDDALMQQAYGKPIDEGHFARNNPAWIVAHNAEAIRDSDLRIMIDAGDEDMYWLYEGTEFLHQVLWDHRIRHEYHLYRGADHIGRSLGPRMRVAFRFLADTLVEPEPDPAVEAGRRRLAPMKAVLDEADHYGIDRDHLRPQ